MIADLKDRPIFQFVAPEGAIIENETAEDSAIKDNINEKKNKEKELYVK
jgi:hypothetical protein